MTIDRGIDAPDERRLAACLQKLARFLGALPFAVCGGVAVQLVLAKHGASRADRRVKDLDVMTDLAELDGLDELPPERFDGWLLSHFHRPHPGYDKRLVQLVDPETRLRVDVFHDPDARWRDSAPHRIGDVTVLVSSARQLLAHKRRLLAGASAERPMDPKHHEDARLLARLLGESEPEVPAACLREDVYGTDLSLRCPRCEASVPLPVPLAPKAEILSLLGYV